MDAHVHFWDTDRFRYPWLVGEATRELPRRYGPEQWASDTAAVAPEAFVHVQAEVDHRTDPAQETAWLDSLRDRIASPFVIIGYADLRDPNRGEVLDRHESFAAFRGIRQEAWFDPESTRADVPKVNLLDDPAFVDGLAELQRRDLVFDLLVWPHQLRQAAAILEDLPELAVAVNHTGLPPSDSDRSAWARDLSRLLEVSPRSVLKISGLGFVDRLWTPAVIDPVIAAAIDLAGPERAMFASNHPAEPPGTLYQSIWGAFDRATRDLGLAERVALFGGTAARFYRIDEVTSARS